MQPLNCASIPANRRFPGWLPPVAIPSTLTFLNCFGSVAVKHNGVVTSSAAGHVLSALNKSIALLKLSFLWSCKTALRAILLKFTTITPETHISGQNYHLELLRDIFSTGNYESAIVNRSISSFFPQLRTSPLHLSLEIESSFLSNSVIQSEQKGSDASVLKSTFKNWQHFVNEHLMSDLVACKSTWLSTISHLFDESVAQFSNSLQIDSTKALSLDPSKLRLFSLTPGKRCIRVSSTDGTSRTRFQLQQIRFCVTRALLPDPRSLDFDSGARLFVVAASTSSFALCFYADDEMKLLLMEKVLECPNEYLENRFYF